MKNKGQLQTNVMTAMMLFVVVGVFGLVSVSMFGSINDNLATVTDGSEASATLGNYSSKVLDSYDLTSSLPIILASALILSVIIGMAYMLR